MKCRIEQLAGLWAGIAGWSVALLWWLGAAKAPSSLAAPALLAATAAIALGAYTHGRYGSRIGLVSCLLGAFVAITCCLAASTIAPFVLPPSIFTPILALLMSRRPAACAAPADAPSRPTGPHGPLPAGAGGARRR